MPAQDKSKSKQCLYYAVKCCYKNRHLLSECMHKKLNIQIKQMAKSSKQSVSSVMTLALLLSLFLVITIAETRSIFPGDLFEPSSTLSCEAVTEVKKGDTCVAVAKHFNLSETSFDAINPNLNCTALFIGQWLCVDGSIN